MSGLYTLVFGVNKLAGPLLHELKIDHNNVPRFRDCFVYHDGQSIVVYTRTGGGNREDYKDQIELMRGHSSFIRDEDDSFDSTYMLFHFRVPEEVQKIMPDLLAKGWGVDPAKRWAETIEEMKKL